MRKITLGNVKDLVGESQISILITQWPFLLKPHFSTIFQIVQVVVEIASDKHIVNLSVIFFFFFFTNGFTSSIL